MYIHISLTTQGFSYFINNHDKVFDSSSSNNNATGDVEILSRQWQVKLRVLHTGNIVPKRTTNNLIYEVGINTGIWRASSMARWGSIYDHWTVKYSIHTNNLA